MAKATSDEEMREVIRHVFGGNPGATYWHVERAWRAHRGQAVAFAEQKRLADLFPQEQHAWQARPGYDQELAAWRGAQAHAMRQTLAGRAIRIFLCFLLGALVLFGFLAGLAGLAVAALCGPVCPSLIPVAVLAAAVLWAIGWVSWMGLRSLVHSVARGQGEA